MECPRCGFSGSPSDALCPNCGAGASAAWPPPPTGQREETSADLPDDPTGEALHQGWRLFLLGLCCAPPVFLPLALWQGIQANRRSGTGAGMRLLIVSAGTAALEFVLLLLWLCRGPGD